jgi:hypothetical protein
MRDVSPYEAELRAHYLAVRRRLNPPPMPVLPPPKPVMRASDWIVGAQSVFAIALIRWWAHELRLRVLTAQARVQAAKLRTMTSYSTRIERAMWGVADRHGVRVRDIIGPSRAAKVCAARFEAFYELRLLGLSTPSIGKRIGGRDHSTVLSGIRRHCWRNRLALPDGVRR